MEKAETIVKAASIRLQPILITSITTICGMLPMVLFTGEGSEMRSPMAVTLGFLFTTVFTHFVVPVGARLSTSSPSVSQRKPIKS